MLRDISNDSLQFILEQSVILLMAEFSALGLSVGDCISLDTKHIIAWVKENNPKAYVSERFNKHKQPAGDPDCKLGCKRKHNRKIVAQPSETPANNPVPANTIAVGQYYWGYGSGITVVKVPEWGEFVLAEKTQTFDKPDVSYFLPLMAQTEQRLGFRLRFGTFDAAFDAFYVYEYFYRADDPGAFAAVPFSEKGGYKNRKFSPEGLPICAASLTDATSVSLHRPDRRPSLNMNAANMSVLFSRRASKTNSSKRLVQFTINAPAKVAALL